MLGLSSLLGGKALIGLGLAALTTIGVLSWMLLESKESQGEAEATALIATGANAVLRDAWQTELQENQEQREWLRAIDARLTEFNRASNRRLATFETGLRNAIAENEAVRAWARRRVPEPVVNELCRAGHIDPAAERRVCGDPGAPDRAD